MTLVLKSLRCLLRVDGPYQPVFLEVFGIVRGKCLCKPTKCSENFDFLRDSLNLPHILTYLYT